TVCPTLSKVWLRNGLFQSCQPFSFSSYCNHPNLLSFPTRRSSDLAQSPSQALRATARSAFQSPPAPPPTRPATAPRRRLKCRARSEEHTSELQSRGHLVCRLLPEKKNTHRGRNSAKQGDCGRGMKS